MTHRQDETASTFILKRVDFKFQNAPDRENFQTGLLTITDCNSSPPMPPWIPRKIKLRNYSEAELIDLNV